MTHTLTRILAVVALLLGLGACSAPTGGTDAGAASPPSDAVVIDVRTASEYAEGHLEGARLLDVTDG